ncbi:uncharacterized protein RJT20DRAFT_126118 [Scheffersomyces xylosifermentans]|uniref:uncharacterized protein n=1 Tax=Scheffersomyces xylosifermentans TaxID=1304137 RepID=UPI00315C7556
MSTANNSNNHFHSVAIPKTTPSKYSNLRVLNHKDTHKAALTLLASFRTDALAKLLVSHIPDQAEKDRCELALYEAYLNQHISKGLCLGINETADSFETVAIWSTPTSVENGLDSFGVLMESGYDKVWQMFGEIGREKVFYGMLPLLHDSCERILSTDSRFRNKGVWTLVYLGSTVAARGKGNARKMFDYMFTQHIDASKNNIAYLESSSPDNIPIYERFGFRFYEDITLGDNATKGAIEGEDFATMNIMIRGTNGHDWTEDKNTFTEKGKL